ncbi:hypothetical protein HXX76_014368 [Chlamydomonas incerta]|uniref:MYND-type domain-containing protein n=1 Tax=Chlamydomonas incerta TaxID=51695 RepID=A0A835SCB4_CHLIN|nr:hypothetical protein HXX76_014368 [Chlamydomonas incerta]|eukprot:KAG2424643.1 hypothetical protein HXX76_014368 [Chlamydomonas incerta]
MAAVHEDEVDEAFDRATQMQLVARLQVALLERLILHGGAGDGDGGGGAGGGGWPGGLSGVPPPPLALLLPLAGRTAEALWRLSGLHGSGGSGDSGVGPAGDSDVAGQRGLGLGGATYGTEPLFTAACSQEVARGFCFSKCWLCELGGASRLERRSPQFEALLPAAIEAQSRYLAYQAAALRHHLQRQQHTCGQESSTQTSATAGDPQASTAASSSVAEPRTAGVAPAARGPWPGLGAAGALISSKRAGMWERELLYSLDIVLSDMTELWSLIRKKDQAKGLSAGCRAAAAAAARRAGLPRTLDTVLRAVTAIQLSAAGYAGGGGRSDAPAPGSDGDRTIQGQHNEHDAAKTVHRLSWLIPSVQRILELEALAAPAAEVMEASAVATAAAARAGVPVPADGSGTRVPAEDDQQAATSTSASSESAAAAGQRPTKRGSDGTDAAAAADGANSCSDSQQGFGAMLTGFKPAVRRQAAVAAEAHAYGLRAACAVGLSHLPITLISSPYLAALVPSALEAWALVATASRAAPGPDGAAGASQLPTAQLFACQPHQLLAAACEALPRVPRNEDSEDHTFPDVRFRLTACVLRVLAAAGSHPQVAPHVLSWLAPAPPVPQQPVTVGTAGAALAPPLPGASHAAGSPHAALRGCMRVALKEALPAMLAADDDPRPGQEFVNRAHAAGVAALLELAGYWAAQAEAEHRASVLGAGGAAAAGGSSSGGSSGWARRASAAAWFRHFCAFAAELLERRVRFQPHELTEEVAEAAEAGAELMLALRLPVRGAPITSALGGYGSGGGAGNGAKKAAAAKQRRQQKQQGGAGGAQDATGGVVLPPPLPVDPVGTALWWLRACGNPGCLEFGGESEVELDLRLCGRCRSVRYCSTACQAAHWQAGHRAVCAWVAAAVASVGV